MLPEVRTGGCTRRNEKRVLSLFLFLSLFLRLLFHRNVCLKKRRMFVTIPVHFHHSKRNITRTSARYSSLSRESKFSSDDSSYVSKNYFFRAMISHIWFNWTLNFDDSKFPLINKNQFDRSFLQFEIKRHFDRSTTIGFSLAGLRAV